MYTIKKDREIDADLIKAVIEYNEKKLSRYDKLYNYYLGKHAIEERVKPDLSANSKITVNHAKYITDTNVGYLLGSPAEYQVEYKENGSEYDIDALKEEYKKQTISDLDHEIAKSISIYGKQFEYIYSNEEAEPKSCLVNNRNTIILYDDTVEHKPVYGIMYIKKPNKEEYEVVVLDKFTKKDYILDGKLLTELESVDHNFGEIPLIEYRNNPEEQGDFEQVISIIDAYNILQSDRINDKEQLVDAILCITGATLEEADAEMLRHKRVLSGIPPDARVEYLTKQLNETQIDILRRNLSDDIHKISMTPNMSDENFVGNSSGVAIRYKLLAFEQNVKNKERYMERGLKERFKLYNNFLTTKSKMEDVPKEKVDVIFKRNLPSNDYEISQMILNLSDFVDIETLISQLSFIEDASKTIEYKEKEVEEKLKTEEEKDYEEVEDELLGPKSDKENPEDRADNKETPKGN